LFHEGGRINIYDGKIGVKSQTAYFHRCFEKMLELCRSDIRNGADDSNGVSVEKMTP
jgi:hypothetical protein